MLVKYSWLSGATVANVLSDIAAILCNTPVANLSAGCDKVNSAIVYNTIASNWEVYDNVALAPVIRSLNADGTSYKYATLGVLTNRLTAKVYESWNAVTHTGLNPGVGGIANMSIGATSPPTPQGATPLTNNGTTVSVAGTLYIYATARTLVVDRILIAEFTRSSVALDSTYPCVTITSINYDSTIAYTNQLQVGICRMKSAMLAGDCTSTLNGGMVQAFLVSPTGYIPSAVANTYAPSLSANIPVLKDPSNQTFYAVDPVYVQANYIYLGKLYEIKMMQSSGIVIYGFDELVVDGVTYIKIGTGPIATFSGLSYLVPKG